jgi:hypothetical protein
MGNTSSIEHKPEYIYELTLFHQVTKPDINTDDYIQFAKDCENTIKHSSVSLKQFTNNQITLNIVLKCDYDINIDSICEYLFKMMHIKLYNKDLSYGFKLIKKNWEIRVKPFNYLYEFMLE